MPVKWSAVKLSEAIDMVEGYVDQAVEPLEQALLVAEEAKRLTTCLAKEDCPAGREWGR